MDLPEMQIRCGIPGLTNVFGPMERQNDPQCQMQLGHKTLVAEEGLEPPTRGL